MCLPLTPLRRLSGVSLSHMSLLSTALAAVPGGPGFCTSTAHPLSWEASHSLLPKSDRQAPA